ncbi:MAG: hypothetical protein WBQ25_01055 [Nitrososphaeraceae archaeon]
MQQQYEKLSDEEKMSSSRQPNQLCAGIATVGAFIDLIVKSKCLIIYLTQR